MKMHRFAFWVLPLSVSRSTPRAVGFSVPFGLVLCLFAAARSYADAAPPNLVFLLIDDLGWSDVTCYGHPFHETPVMDQLARDGLRFTHFYAATPVCSSTRSTIQTGQYSPRTGITDFIPGHWRPYERLIVPPIEHHLQAGVKSLGELFRSAGYATGYFGKWHLGNDHDHGPNQHGYTITESQLGPEFAATWTDRDKGPKSIDYLTAATQSFINQHRSAPFFVTLSHFAVHIPVEARAATAEKYQRKEKPSRGVNHVVYAAMIEELDTSLGQILQQLDELGLAENTIVILASDNGGLRQIFTGQGEIVSTNEPLRGEKGTLYEGGIRVPCIIRWPGQIAAGGVCDEPATTADLLPTFCDAAAIPLPQQPVDGLSLLPLCRDPAASLARDAIYFHYPHYHHSRPASAVRSGDWKLIEFLDDASLELYNVQQDVGETTNLADQQPARVRELRQRLTGWRDGVGARMPTPNPQYDPRRAAEWWSRQNQKPLKPESMRDGYRSRIQ